MSYEQDQMSGSYDEDDDCLSLNADNEFVPTSPPEGPTMHSPQTLMQPKQAQQQQQQPLLMTTTDAPVQQPQIFAYSGPTEVVHTIEWTTKPDMPHNSSTHFVYIDLYARNPGGTPELPFFLSTNSATPPGAWHTNSKFLTRTLKMAASQASTLWPFKMFKDEGYEIVLRKPQFLYYYKDLDNMKVFQFHHPMDQAAKARAPQPYTMTNGQQPYTKITIYVDVEFRYQPKPGFGINDPMIRNIIESVQKAKAHWLTMSLPTATTTRQAAPATTTTTAPIRQRSRSRQRGDKRHHEHPDLRQELTAKRAEGRESKSDENNTSEGRRWRQ